MTDLDQRGATGPAIYRGMDRPTLDAAYNNSAAVADSPGWLARGRERSAIVRASPDARLDIVYGPRPRARLDYFPCGKKQAPLFVFIHGGYWQRNEKETFAFVADGPRAIVAIAKRMPQGANIILCSAEPAWYKAAEEGDSFRTLTHAARIAEYAKDEDGNAKNLKIPLVLSGDSHHYARYVGDGTHYVTSGGAGAFLNGTLELESKINAKWMRDEHATLELETCYPSQVESNRLLDGNKRFGVRNPGLTWALAGLYLICSFALTSLHTGSLNWDVALIEFLILAGGLWSYARYQERHPSVKIMLAAATQPPTCRSSSPFRFWQRGSISASSTGHGTGSAGSSISACSLSRWDDGRLGTSSAGAC